MRPSRLIVALCVLGATWLSASPALASCDGTPGRSGPLSLTVGADTRTFSLRVPSSADGVTPAPVLLAFHPFGMNGQYMQSRVSSRVWPEAIMVYPDALRTGGGAPGWQGRAGDMNDRDLAFFDAMLAWLRAEQCIEERRVFVLGYSNGAGLANLIACERPEAVAGVALAAGRPTCAPGSPKPVVIGHGLRDSTVGYEQAVTASRTWATRNGCAAPPDAGTPGCSAATSCSAAPTTLCTHTGGHEYSATFTRTVAEFFQSLEP